MTESGREQRKIRWKPLESNPETYNKYIKKIGVSGVECIEVYGFDPELLEFIPKPHLALIFCFPDYDKAMQIMKPIYDTIQNTTIPQKVFFMKQKISNACGTFALFHSLANNLDKINMADGPFHKWLQEAKGLPVDQRSDSLALNTSLSEAHEDCADEGETENSGTKVDHHFVAYINIDDRLIEFDSSQSFPRDCGITDPTSFLSDAGKVCMDLMLKLDDKISCNAIALVKS